MKRYGGDADCGHDDEVESSNTSKSKGVSNIINTQFKKISLEGSSAESARTLSSSKSLTNSHPTILVHIPDTNSYHFRSAMSIRTLHDSLQRGSQAGTGEERCMSMSRSVSFVNVNIREYERILGDNPSCTSGPPLSIGWKHSPSPIVISVDDYEDGKDEPRSSANFLVSKAIRERVLKEHACVTRKEIVGTVRSIKKQKSQRRKTADDCLGMQGIEEQVESVRRTIQKAVGKRKSYSATEKKLWDDAHERAVVKAKNLEESIRKGESISVHNVYSVGTPENCMNMMHLEF